MMSTPGVDGLGEVVRVLRQWQYDGTPIQLHPGDLGWHWRFGAQTTARAVRTWSRDGEILALGLLDGPGLVRLAVAPGARLDEELARQMVADVTQPERGVLPQGTVSVEARCDGVFRVGPGVVRGALCCAGPCRAESTNGSRRPAAAARMSAV